MGKIGLRGTEDITVLFLTNIFESTTISIKTSVKKM